MQNTRPPTRAAAAAADTRTPPANSLSLSSSHISLSLFLSRAPFAPQTFVPVCLLSTQTNALSIGACAPATKLTQPKVSNLSETTTTTTRSSVHDDDDWSLVAIDQLASVERNKTRKHVMPIEAAAAGELWRRNRAKRVAMMAPNAAAPKLVQWAKEAVQYYEGSKLFLSCSLALQQPDGAPPLKFAWFKQGKPLTTVLNSPLNAPSGGNRLNSQQDYYNNNNNNRLSIETLPDYSLLKLQHLRSTDSGAYTCVASNSYGQEDRTTSQVIVNGR